MKKIKHKIANVPSEVCQGCSQPWHGECRPHCVPHSKEEVKHRGHGRLLCAGRREEDIHSIRRVQIDEFR